MIDPDICWQAVQDRDPAWDGRFFYAVITTGVFCRPSCPSRPKRRENVRFFATVADAQAAGFRACLRCHPLRDGADPLLLAAARRIADSDPPPDLVALAAEAGLSPGHFQRKFKALFGLSPKQYEVGVRRQRFRTALDQSDSVTAAVFEAGFGAPSRAYDSGGTIGMTPQTYRRGGAGEQIRTLVVTTSLGPLLVAATDKGVCSAEFGEPAELLARLTARFPQADIRPQDDSVRAWAEQVVAAIDHPGSASVPLDLRGTAFQERVWQALTAIPLGRTISYGDLAVSLGQPKAVRAVARACGANNIAMLVPCHRVIGRSGDLTGYKWGLERKRRLLAREAGNSELDL